MNNAYTLDCSTTYYNGGGAGSVYLNGEKIGRWQWYMDAPTCHPFYEIESEYEDGFYDMLNTYGDSSMFYGTTFFVRSFDKDFLADEFFDPGYDLWLDRLEEEPDEEWKEKHYGCE